jgi:hypothetical protein
MLTFLPLSLLDSRNALVTGDAVLVGAIVGPPYQTWRPTPSEQEVLRAGEDKRNRCCILKSHTSHAASSTAIHNSQFAKE